MAEFQDQPEISVCTESTDKQTEDGAVDIKSEQGTTNLKTEEGTTSVYLNKEDGGNNNTEETAGGQNPMQEMSKNQMRKLKKRERWLEHKPEKRYCGFTLSVCHCWSISCINE